MIYLIRHAEKKDNEVHAQLTEKGLKDSFIFGKKLKEQNIQIDKIISSPIIRCLQTAMKIIEGYDIKTIQIEQSNLLGDPGVYIQDDKKAMKIFKTYKLVDIINMQLAHKKLDGFNSIDEGSRQLLEFINNQKKNTIMISHDAIITPFIAYINNLKKIETKDIVQYLQINIISNKT